MLARTRLKKLPLKLAESVEHKDSNQINKEINEQRQSPGKIQSARVPLIKAPIEQNIAAPMLDLQPLYSKQHTAIIRDKDIRTEQAAPANPGHNSLDCA